MIALIVACSTNRVIGNEGQLPWRQKADMQRFKTTTTGHAVLMGRKTYDSIGKPLPRRVNIVLTRSMDVVQNMPEVIPAETELRIMTSLDALRTIAARYEKLFVIGGAEIYAQALPYCDEVFLTTVQCDVEGDAFFPPLDPDEWYCEDAEAFQADADNQYPYIFHHFKRVRKG